MENIIEKIKKLMAHAESAKDLGSIAESEAFISKAMDLARKAAIDLNSINFEEEPSTKIIHLRFPLSDLEKSHEGQFIPNLLGVVAKANQCRVIFSTANGTFILVGQKHSIELTYYLVEQVAIKIREEARRAFKQYTGPEKRNTFFRGFYLGAVIGIKERLEEEEHEELKENQSYALVVHKVTDLVNSYVNDTFNLRNGGTGRALRGAGGFGKGKEAAKNISINKGIAASKTSQLKLN
jgi:hypothetical protein